MKFCFSRLSLANLTISQRGGKSIAEAMKLHKQRQDAKTTVQQTPYQSIVRAMKGASNSCHTIPLSMNCCGKLRKLYPRKKNWRDSIPTTTSDHIDIENFQYKGRFAGWHGSYYRECIQSCGVVVKGHLFAVISGKLYHYAPKRGWKWKVDKLGICYARNTKKIEYHPTSSDILRNVDFAQLAIENNEVRKRQEKANRFTRQQLRGVRVCIKDSLQVGNCEAGTLAWCRQHRLDTTRGSYSATYLQRKFRNDERMPLVIAKAVQRHRQEKRLGV
jgi:hypothetical protein